MAAAIVHRLDNVISVKLFAIAFAASFILLIAGFVAAGMMGSAPSSSIEKLVSINPEKTVEVSSGDLNQLDITAPPPKPAATTEAGKPQARHIKPFIDGLHEKTAYGLAPIIHKTDGLTPFKAYAAEFTPDPAAKALISFVMVDFGLSQKNSSASIKELPEGVSFTLDAYTRDAQTWANHAREMNHEVWLSLPLQSKNYPQVDTGPKTILASLSPGDTNNRILDTLGIATGYVGVITNNASAFESAKPSLQKSLSSIAERGLGIVQSDPADRTLGGLAAQTKAPFGQANLWIDQINSEKDLQAQFINIESSAVKNKKLIVFFRPYPATIKAITNWAKQAGNRGIQLAPLSAVISQ